MTFGGGVPLQGITIGIIYIVALEKLQKNSVLVLYCFSDCSGQEHVALTRPWSLLHCCHPWTRPRWGTPDYEQRIFFGLKFSISGFFG